MPARIASKPTLKDKLRQLWWSLTSELNGKIDTYEQVARLHDDIVSGLLRLEHMRGAILHENGGTIDFGICRTLMLLLGKLIDDPDARLVLDRMRVLFEAQALGDESLLDPYQRQELSNLLSALADELDELYLTKEALRGIAERLGNLRVSCYKVPRDLASTDCAAFDK